MCNSMAAQRGSGCPSAHQPPVPPPLPCRVTAGEDYTHPRVALRCRRRRLVQPAHEVGWGARQPTPRQILTHLPHKVQVHRVKDLQGEQRCLMKRSALESWGSVGQPVWCCCIASWELGAPPYQPAAGRTCGTPGQALSSRAAVRL